MKATEIRDKIFAINKELHEISNQLAGKSVIDWDGIDAGYLESKITGEVINISKHIQGQLKNIKKYKHD